MSESWREFLYPLGYLSAIAFGGRFLLQWALSEIHRESIVTRSFWRLSLVGNILLLVHSFLQVQFHVSLIQACNAVVSWRNLNLMEESSKRAEFATVIKLLVAALGTVTIGFFLQGYLQGSYIFFRLPHTEFSEEGVSFLWHLLGFLGLALFSCRFWIQWWYAERDAKSYLSPTFWWLSLVGGLLSLIYFIYIDDTVNIIGPAFGLIPYIRNLMLIQNAKNRVGAT